MSLEEPKVVAATPVETERLERAAVAAGVGIWEYFPATGEFRGDPRWNELFGFPSGAQVSYRDWLDRMHPDDREGAAEALRQACNPGGALECCCHCRIVAADGITRRLLLKGNARPGGEPFRLIGIAVKVQAEDGQDAYRHSLEAQAQLAGGLAHDFNNLLSVLTGHTSLALRHAGDAEASREHLEQIARAGDRAVALIQQLLSFSQRQFLEPRPVDLNSAIRAMEPSLRILAGARVELVLHPDSKPALAQVDPRQLEVAVSALVAGAAEVTGGGGRLKIETRSAEAPGQYAVLCATHSGRVGGDASRLFEPYYSIEPSRKGARLALAAVYGFARQSGGYVSAQLGADETAFMVYLPAAPADAVTSPVSAPRLRGSETVLLVDERPSFRESRAAALRLFGYRVLEAAGAGEAMLAARSRGYRVDLLITGGVVTDGTMAGWDLADTLSAFCPGLRALFLMSEGEARPRTEQLADPSRIFLEPPFDEDRMAGQVREALAAPVRPRTILLVDDDPQVRSLLHALLRNAGYQVIVATDGAEAIATSQERSFDLLLTDLIMPKREGLETIRHFRKNYPKVRIIAMSGSFDRGFLSMAGRLGAEAILQKPIQSLDLIETVGKILSSPGAGHGAPDDA